MVFDKPSRDISQNLWTSENNPREPIQVQVHAHYPSFEKYSCNPGAHKSWAYVSQWWLNNLLTGNHGFFPSEMDMYRQLFP